MLQISPSAILEIKRLQMDSPHLEACSLRITASENGCSGIAFEMEFWDQAPTESDTVIKTEGLSFLVDRKSILLLQASELDFTNEGPVPGFLMHHPLPGAGCKTCGSATACPAESKKSDCA